jgi:predicted DNA binding CopG/RHH family protein
MRENSTIRKFLIVKADYDVVFSNLHHSTKTISIRLPESLLNQIKVRANSHDVPY